MSAHRNFVVFAAGVGLHLLFLFLFDFTVDIFEEMSGTRLEVLVHVHILSFVVPDFFETVHVELSDEGGEIAMFEVGGKDVLCEASDAFDGKGVAGRGPGNDV